MVITNTNEERVTKIDTYLNAAEVFAYRSTCLKRKYGAVIVKDDAALGNEAVGVQHAGEGLGQHGFPRAGFTDDRDGFMFIDIQADVPDRGQDPAAYIEFDADVFQGKEDLSVFVCHFCSICFIIWSISLESFELPALLCFIS